ncbi:MAG: response regulator [Ruminiclostridium sp.]|nr:response regulator [Ruminiclostridium sp.]
MATNGIPEILIASQGSACMVNSIENNLKKEGLYVTRCEAAVRDIDEHIGGKDMVILFAGEYITQAGSALSYISSKCADECIQLCIVGYPNEIQVIEKTVSVGEITAEFPRPFDMKEFTSKIKELANRETSTAVKKEEAAAAEKKVRHSILLCDDDMMFLKMVQEWLKEAYNVTIVKTGLMAVPFALNNQPDLILLDFEMPVMNGPKVLEALRGDKKTAQIPVVFLTGHSDKDSVMEVMKLRPQGYLLKSTKKEDIIASVDNFFATGQWKNIQA